MDKGVCSRRSSHHDDLPDMPPASPDSQASSPTERQQTTHQSLPRHRLGPLPLRGHPVDHSSKNYRAEHSDQLRLALALAHLDRRSEPTRSSLVRVRVRRSRRQDRPPLLLPTEIQAILDGCAVADPATGDWTGNLRDRLVFALLAETGMRLGELLGMRINDFVMGRGGTPLCRGRSPRGQPERRAVKMMRPRRIHVGADLERLFADYLSDLACRAAALGLVVTADSALFVNLQRPPLFAALREGTVRDKTTALRTKRIGPPGWTPHWFRHSHATALLLAGTPEWVVSRRLGHAHVQTTLDLYGWMREDEALRAAANWKSYVAGWQVRR
jgi:integrase